ncbi:DUF3772 domain-containing protein [Paracoccus aerodenitrificans]|uniref:DUF3772 domain-containing protein n=1 Tax=Paracoccus aerodenitrificans TaxID=3017781 RepID=UPI0022F0E461|nr:DUF3772 domain-containing protein [Paracoccus aerodenitrificans]WBU65556.1 DUF3772 domain-containing protein [Paracoccus aerodenitrificans]
MTLILNIFRAAFVALLLLVSQLSAQEANQIDYPSWESFASQAETALEDESTAPSRLESIRENATQWRQQFEQAQNTNASRIQTVRDQIASLGPVPAEGESESEDVAQRRQELNEQLSQLQAPGITATEAYSRAESIIQQAAEIERERNAQELMAETPSPLLPSSWLAAGRDILAIISGVVTDARENWRNASGISEPGRLMLFLFGVAALVYGRHLVDRLPSRIGERAEGDMRAVIAFIVSLAQFMVPTIGIFLIANAIASTGLAGEWILPFLLGWPFAGLVFFVGRWLIRTLFAAEPVAYATLIMPQTSRRMARLYGTGLIVVFGLHVWLSNAALPLSGFVRRDHAPPMIPYDVSDAGAGVIHFFLLVIGAFFLFQLANILRRMKKFYGTDSPPYRAIILSYVGRFLRLVVLVSILAAMLGYVNGANALFWPSVKSLGLIGLLILLQDFMADSYSLLSKSKEGARDSLVPVLIGLALVVISIPFFALIWGASLTDLAEAWTQIRQGFSVGGITLSPGAIVTFLVVFALGYMVTKWMQGIFRATILPRTRLDKGAQAATVSGLGYVGVFLAALFAITSAGIDLSSIALVAGALSVGIGFGLQTIVQNFVSGIILLIERPISVGDWVEAGGQQGVVQNVSVRSTRIKTFDQTDVIVPNSDLISQSVTNWTRGNSRGRIIISVGVAYGTDTRKVERILMEIAEDQPTVLFDPPPAVLFQGFGADSLDFEIRAILSDINGGLGVSSEIRHQIAKRFADEGIEIPFAQRDVWLRNPESLRPDARNEDAAKPAEPEEPREQASVAAPDKRTIAEFPSDGDGGADGDGDY